VSEVLFRRFVVVTSQNRLPDNCSSEQASLAEPLSVVIHAAKRANLTAGQTVLVFGAGTIGLLVCAYAKCLGAARVVALDIKRDRLDFANANGFVSQTYCLTPSDSSKTSEEKLRRSREAIQVALKEFGQEDGFDVVFECSGADPCVQMSCYVRRSHACLFVSVI
jgi:L-iditol 2-dehydrogenase